MNSNVISSGSENIQSRPDGILPMLTTRNDLPHFLELGGANELLQFWQPVGLSHQNNFGHAIGLFECLQGMPKDRLPGEEREKFIKTHSTAVTRGDDDGAEHADFYSR